MNEYDLKRYRQEREDEENGRKLAKDLGRLVNRMGGNGKAEGGFVDELTNREHRTLQQSAGGLMFKVIEKWAKDYEKGQYDGRNEYLLKTCSKIVAENPDIFEFGMPMI
jgi:hypothetical protein